MLVGDFVFPGDHIDLTKIIGEDELDLSKYKHIIGPGLHFNSKSGVVATVSGVLKSFNKLLFRGRPNVTNEQKSLKSIYLWVEYCQKSYVPCKGDLVIGTIVKCHPQDGSFIIDIDSNHDGNETPRMYGHAILPDQSFEGATKRNKPDLRPGDIIFGKIEQANRGIDPLLTCKSNEGQNKYLYGILNSAANLLTHNSTAITNAMETDDIENQASSPEISPITGFMWQTTIDHVTKLMKLQNMEDENNVLKIIGKCSPYEMVVGMNGRIWIRAGTAKNIFYIYCIIKSLRNMPLSEWIKFWTPILSSNDGWKSVNWEKWSAALN